MKKTRLIVLAMYSAEIVALVCIVLCSSGGTEV